MQSMTGFGIGQHGPVEIQIATVNAKAVQINVRSDLRDLGLEESVRTRVREALTRGTVTVTVRCQPAEAVVGFDPQRLAAAWSALATVAQQLGAPAPTLEVALSCVGQTRSDVVVDYGQVLVALDLALAALGESRNREGAALHADLHAKAAQLRAIRGRMTPAAAARLPRIRTALLERLREVLAAQPPVPDDILARELALHADRCDVSEELTRLDAHLGALDRLLASREPVGRQLEFLLQEIGRECNTTGAKSNDIDLTALVLEAKVVLEQVREQVANVE